MKPLVSDDIWALVEPLLPPARPRRRVHPGRLPLGDREILTGIVFVLKSGINWDDLPTELGWGCGRTCRERLKRWQRIGVWQQLHSIILSRLNAADKIDWSRAAVDSRSVRSPGGGEATRPNPTDRRKLGSKHHILVEGNGIPLAAMTTGANRHVSKGMVPLLERLPEVRGKVGRLRRFPGQLFGDRAYDSEALRGACEIRGIIPHLARRRTEHGSGLGTFRWPVERTICWLHRFRRLGRRLDRLLLNHDAFLTLACALIAFRFL